MNVLTGKTGLEQLSETSYKTAVCRTVQQSAALYLAGGCVRVP